jgi:hypothetical protein
MQIEGCRRDGWGGAGFRVPSQFHPRASACDAGAPHFSALGRRDLSAMTQLGRMARVRAQRPLGVPNRPSNAIDLLSIMFIRVVTRFVYLAVILQPDQRPRRPARLR